ncbi:MAG: YqgE/AlgH family protein [Rhizomicrobium sp.]|jgi:putative transcriptional regulator
MAQAKPRESQNGESFLEGKLLIAMPGMPDPRFEKSVIFMCAHSAQSAMGLIINKPIDGLSFHELMPKLGIGVTANRPDAPILFGGPVQMGRGFVLHSADYGGEDTTLSLTPEISLTATVDILRAISEGRGPEKSILALGYAGWGEGQIEEEIKANGWIHCDADTRLVFDTDYASRWRTAIAKLGADISGLSAEAGRA